MSELRDILRAGAPLNIHDFMQTCLSHPTQGYYMKGDPFGRGGDFVTAPEISQMFGEMIGLWLVQCWVDQGRPTPFILAELGPGRGTLMADILRVSAVVPEFQQAAQIVLVETSPALRKIQTTLGDVQFVARVEDIPDGPLFIIANEFFDALPIHQYRRIDNFWQERLVNAQFDEEWARPLARPDLDRAFPMIAENRVVETNPLAESIATHIRERIAETGAALFIDYGDWDGVGDTLQAIQSHKMVDALKHEHGNADLTAHVRFRPLADGRYHFTTQGAFLRALGIEARAKMLAKKNPDEITAALHRLTDNTEMGELFKVLALLPETAPAALGFTDDA